MYPIRTTHVVIALFDELLENFRDANFPAARKNVWIETLPPPHVQCGDDLNGERR